MSTTGGRSASAENGTPIGDGWVSRSSGVGLEDLFKLLAFDAADRDPKGTSPALFTHRLAVAQLWEKPSAVTTFCHRERERAISSSTLHSPPPANAR